jgi:glycosyltransferase involved in cell wall biosynthesis
LTFVTDRRVVRIGLVTDTYTPQVNGVTTIVRRIVAALEQAGHEVGVVAPRYPARARPEGPGELRVPSIPFPPYPAIRLSWPQSGLVTRFLDALRPDLVHVHTEGPLGLVGRAYALKRQLPLVTSFHTDFPRYARHYGAAVLEPVVWRWLAWFHGAAALTLTPGDAIQAELARHIGHARVWGRGVDAREFHPSRRDASWRRWLGGGDATAIVLHVGRLAPEKNLDVLIAAWRAARDRLGERATFVVAGEGPWRRRIVAQLPFVRELGFLPRGQLATLYASADLCVLPSATETCGLVALEAMASGLPVIAADAGGLRESIRHGESGLLIRPDNAPGFAAAIEELVTLPARRFALAAAARERALERDSSREDAELLERYAHLAIKSAGATACAA